MKSSMFVFIALLLAYQVVQAQGAMPELKFINPPTLYKPPTYSHVVETKGGRMIFIAGQVSNDTTGKVIGKGDFKVQTRQVFQNLKAALAAVGADFSHVVKMNSYFTNMAEQLPVFRQIRNEYLNMNAPPASTAVEVRRLASEDYLLEVEVIAVVP